MSLVLDQILKDRYHKVLQHNRLVTPMKGTSYANINKGYSQRSLERALKKINRLQSKRGIK